MTDTFWLTHQTRNGAILLLLHEHFSLVRPRTLEMARAAAAGHLFTLHFAFLLRFSNVKNTHNGHQFLISHSKIPQKGLHWVPVRIHGLFFLLYWSQNEGSVNAIYVKMFSYMVFRLYGHLLQDKTVDHTGCHVTLIQSFC